MRKIFIDGGANKGQSTQKFIECFNDSKEYEIYMFAPEYKNCTKHIDKIINKFDDHNIEYIKNALWKNNDMVTIPSSNCGESSSIFNTNTHSNHYKVNSTRLSEWIQNNFDEEDYIILKLDIEGAEYEVVEDLYETKILGYINEFHGELHGPKKGKRMIDDLKLIERLKKYDLKLYTWNGSNKIKSIYHSYYDHETMIREYKKWSKRNYPTDDFMKEIKIYLSDTDDWRKKNL